MSPVKAFVSTVRTEASLERMLAFTGAASAVAGLVQFVLPSLPATFGPGFAAGTLALSAIGIGIVGSRKRRIVASHPDRDWSIELEIGDLFTFPHIAVTADRAFETENVGPDSLMAQLLASGCGSEPGAISSALQAVRLPTGLVPCGTTVTVTAASRSVEVVAVSMPANAGPSVTRWPDLWASYDGLWNHLRHTQTMEIAIPVIGAGFAGAALDRKSVLSALVVSFHAACIESVVCRRLRIVMPAEDAGLMSSASGLLRSLGYSLQRSRSVSAATEVGP